MNKKMLFVYNPKSGTGRIKNQLANIVELFAQNEYEITIHPTMKKGDAVSLLEHMKGYDLVVCSGGDGTLDEVVTGMMKGKRKVPIAYIPAGSTNDFANSLKIPKNMMKAAYYAMNGTAFLCDVGAFDDNYFLYVAAFGIFTEVSYATDQQMKNKIGHLAYILEGTLRLPQTKSYYMKIRSDVMTVEGEFIFGMVSNSRSIGGMPNLTGKKTELNDGLFEVTLIRRPKNPIEMNKIMSSLFVEDEGADMVYCFKTSKIEIESEEEVPWTLDGEFGGRKKTVCIHNMQNEIKIMVPNKVKKS